MLDFFLAMNSKAPKTVKELLKNHFNPYLDESAMKMHRLIVEKYSLISDLVLESQSMSYIARANKIGGQLSTFEGVMFKQDQLDEDLIVINISNQGSHELKQLLQKEEIIWHDQSSASLAITAALIAEPRYNICAANHTKNVCLWILACIELLGKTHQFNISVTANMGMHFRAFSQTSSTFVSVKTRSWTDASLDQFIAENPNFILGPQTKVNWREYNKIL